MMLSRPAPARVTVYNLGLIGLLGVRRMGDGDAARVGRVQEPQADQYASQIQQAIQQVGQ
jgi:hypothetical protein